MGNTEVNGTIKNDEAEKYSIEQVYDIRICKEGYDTSTCFKEKTINILKRGYKSKSKDKSIRFKFGKQMSECFCLPGILEANVCGDICTDMVPQGITYYGGYYFVSAYCKKSIHNSVIYVVDGETKDYITTLVLKGKPHAGGVTVAGGYMWVCGTSRIYYYDYKVIDAAIKTAKETLEPTLNNEIKSIGIEAYGREIKLAKGEKASFVTTYTAISKEEHKVNGVELSIENDRIIATEYLCVGAYEKSEKTGGKLRFYKPEPSDKEGFKCINSMDIIAKAQGVDFFNKEGEEYMLITRSFGITRSKIYVYKRQNDGDFKVINKITFPRMLEEVVVRDNYTYCVFESGAKKYRMPLMSVVGDICVFDNDFIVGEG